jgi:hypothetical protein
LYLRPGVEARYANDMAGSGSTAMEHTGWTELDRECTDWQCEDRDIVLIG